MNKYMRLYYTYMVLTYIIYDKCTIGKEGSSFAASTSSSCICLYFTKQYTPHKTFKAHHRITFCNSRCAGDKFEEKSLILCHQVMTYTRVWSGKVYRARNNIRYIINSILQIA